VRVVVTGGSGQLGSLVLARLIQNRKIKQVVTLDLLAPIVKSGKLDWKIADVRDPGLERHFEGADALVHLAFAGRGPRATPEAIRAVNIDASKKLFAHAIDQGLKKILLVSSVAAYGLDGPHPVPIEEDAPRRSTPWLTYADQKWELEQQLDELERAHPEVAIVRLRPGVLLGRRMVEQFSKPLRRGILPKLGSARIPLVWDEDAADALLLALLADVRGAFNLCADDPLPAEELAQAGGLKLVPVPKAARSGWAKLAAIVDRAGAGGDPAWLRAGDVDLQVSSERAKRELGWQPTCRNAREVMQRFAAEAPRRVDPRIATFLSMLDLLGRRFAAIAGTEDAKRVKLELHLNLTGPRGGDYALSLSDAKLRIRAGVPRPPETVLTMRAETLLEMLSGRTDLSAARMTGKVRMHGDPQGAFFLGALITGFRNSVAAGGVRGWSTGKLSSWFERGTGGPT
jgi:UDP-glucose 4-epimerase